MRKLLIQVVGAAGAVRCNVGIRIRLNRGFVVVPLDRCACNTQSGYGWFVVFHGGAPFIRLCGLMLDGSYSRIRAAGASAGIFDPEETHRNTRFGHFPSGISSRYCGGPALDTTLATTERSVRIEFGREITRV
jgi:hypothetical protein